MDPTLPFINFHAHHQSNIDGVLTVVNIDLGKNESWSPLYQACSVGIHPWSIDKNTIIQHFFQLEDACKNENVVAVGEVGLDKLIDTPLTLQSKVLEQQIEIADFFNKPIIIHCIGAYYELIAIKKKLKTNISFVIHGFNKNAQVMKDLLDNGFYLSLGTALNQTGSPLLQLVKDIPSTRLLLETDDKNSPIQGMYLVASEVLKIDIEELKLQIYDNYKRILKIQ